MATRIKAPTDEELAEMEQTIVRRQAEQEFEENRVRLNNLRPKGAAKISRLRDRAFGASVPPVSRGPIDLMPDEQPPEPVEEKPVDSLRSIAQPPKQKKKGKFDVPEARTAQTLLKAIGLCYVEERQKNPIEAYEHVRDAVMSNLDLLLPLMSQIKQMFELLELGKESEKGERGNGRQESIADSMGKLRKWMQGDDE